MTAAQPSVIMGVVGLFSSILRRKTVAQLRPGELYEEVLSAMSEVQDYAISHGGRIELVEVTDEGEVRIRFHGACRGCPLSGFTLKNGIEEQLRILVPMIQRVVQVK
jgi:Fe-S cluster biogenesis protein NfuA